MTYRCISACLVLVEVGNIVCEEITLLTLVLFVLFTEQGIRCHELLAAVLLLHVLGEVGQPVRRELTVITLVLFVRNLEFMWLGVYIFC